MAYQATRLPFANDAGNLQRSSRTWGMLMLWSLMAVFEMYRRALTWTEWSEWACPVTYGGGTQTRSKSIVNTTTEETEEMSCPHIPCPIDGAWTPWSEWSTCDVTCSIGNEIRTRTCTYPAPQYGGQDCIFVDTFQGRPCFQDPCPRDLVYKNEGKAFVVS
ncbi:thrombospondin-1-like [Saccoglossus kowalevskii]